LSKLTDRLRNRDELGGERGAGGDRGADLALVEPALDGGPITTPSGADAVAAVLTVDPPPRSRRALLFTFARRALVPLLLIGAWQVAASAGWINTTLTSSPAEVASAFWKLLTDGELTSNLVISLRRMGIGLLIGLPIGFVFGVIAGLSRLGEELVDSTMQALRVVPFVSLVPLFMLWFGIGEGSKVALVAFGVAFPIYLNTYSGIRSVDAKLIEAARVFGLGRAGLIRQVIVPGALPSILVGIRYALGIAVIALVVAETVDANSGIGALVANARQFLETDIVFVGIVVYSALGLIGDFIVRVAERRLLTWRGSFEG
jgi:sulfonate transport system permease protein